MSENFEFKIDNRLTKTEINEVKSYSEEKIETLLETDKLFNDFINTEYRWANENYLSKNNKSVLDLQESLGFSKKDIDGVFGKKTFFAVIKYQKENNLVIDGLVGDKTQSILFKNNNKKENNKINKYSKYNYSTSYLSNNTSSPVNNYDYFNNNEVSNSSLDLASFLEQKNYPKYVSGASCGANVGNLLNQYGIDGLPNYGRHGYRWSNILENNPNFVKQEISSPYEANPGGILVYDKGYGNTKSRQNYGHVEIVTNDGYYFGGNPKKNPGGSSLEGFTGYVYYPKVA